MPEESVKTFARCKVCGHPDRGWIEHLMASGAGFRDLSEEFSLDTKLLRRHDQLHSTVQPNVDPVSIIREMRYLMSHAEDIDEKIARAHGNAAKKWDSELDAIKVRLSIVNAYANIINAKKHLEQSVTLPRWNNVMKRIVGALEEHPAAMREVYKVMREFGPKGSSTYGIAKPPDKVDRNLRDILSQEPAAEVPEADGSMVKP